MRGWGKALLIIGAIVIFVSLGMDTSVPTDSGRRVHNLGLMRDQSNYMTIGALMAGAGLLMLLFGAKGQASSGGPKPSPQPHSPRDPFDELEETRRQERDDSYTRKKYAISLGVVRKNGTYWVGYESFADLEEAIKMAEQQDTDGSRV